MKSIISTALLTLFLGALVAQDTQNAGGAVRICEVLRDYYVYADTREPVLDERGNIVWAGLPYEGECMTFQRKPNNWPIKDANGYSGGAQRVLNEAKLRSECADCNRNARERVDEMVDHHHECIDSATTIAERHCSAGYQIGAPKGDPVPRTVRRCWQEYGLYWKCEIRSDEWNACIKGWLNGSSETVVGDRTNGTVGVGDFATLEYNGEQHNVSFGVQNGIGQKCNELQSDEWYDINKAQAACVRGVNVQAQKAHSDFRCKKERAASRTVTSPVLVQEAKVLR